MDLGRTINSPSNSLRIFKAQLELTARAIGSLFIPALQAILPPAIAVVTVIREVIASLAALVGFTMPDFTIPDDTKYGSIVSGVDSIGDSASKAAKEMNYLIGGFDELNVMNKDTGSGGSGGAGGIGNILGDIELPEYDMFNDYVANQVSAIADSIRQTFKNIKDQLEPFMPLLKGIATAFLAAFATKKILEFFKAFKEGSKFLKVADLLFSSIFHSFKTGSTLIEKISNGFKGLWGNFSGFMQSLSPLTKAVVTVAALAGEFVAVSDAMKEFELGNISLLQTVGQVTVAFGAASIALAGMFGGAGVAISAAVAIAAALKGISDAQKEMDAQFVGSYLFNNGGVKLEQISGYYNNLTAAVLENVNAYNQSFTAFDESSAKVDELSGRVNGLLSEMQISTGEISNELVPELAQAYTDLADAIKEKLTIANDTTKQFFMDNVSYFESLGYNVEEFVQSVDAGAGETLPKLEELKAKANALKEEIASGSTDAGLWEELVKINEEIAAIDPSTAIGDFGNLKNSISLHGIDFGSYDDITSKISEIETAYDGLTSNIEEARKQMETQLASATFASDEDKERAISAMNSYYDSLAVEAGNQAAELLNLLNSQFIEQTNKAIEEMPITDSDRNLAYIYLEKGLGGGSEEEARAIVAGRVQKNIVDPVTKEFESANESLKGKIEAYGGTLIDSYANGINSEATNAKMKGVGGNLTAGMIDGAAEYAKTGDYSGITSSLLSSVKAAFGIHSPSTVMYDEVGVYLAQGMLQGMLETLAIGYQDVYTSIDNFINYTVAPLFAVYRWSAIFANVVTASRTKTTEAISDWKKQMDTWVNVDVKQMFDQKKWEQHYSGMKDAFSQTTRDIMEDWRKFETDFTNSFKRLISDLQDYADRHPIIIEVKTVRVGGYGDSDEGEVSSRRTVPALAKGGVLTSPTLVYAGEYSGASTDPEIVSPQSIMRETVEEANASVVSALYTLIEIAQQIADKDTVVELDGDEVGRSIDKSKRTKGFDLGVVY